VARAVDKLTRAGIPVGNQSVLLAGVNDCVNIQRDLVHRLVEMRVRPYYIYQCDLVEGSGHFRTPVGKGLEIMEGLRGHLSGLAQPTYVVDCPHGGGKVPLMPNYLVSASDDCVVLRTYDGMLVRFRAEDKQPTIKQTATRGVSQLVQGTKTKLVPEDNEHMARRKRFKKMREAIKAEREAEAASCGSGLGNGRGKQVEREDLMSLPVVG
jgi:lysine 2,3-aminomutase